MQNIILIEDNKEVRENTAEILELAGYQVKTAEDGKKGVELVNANKPDLIICDIMMPVLDGYGVLHLLSKNESTSGIPFIFLTAKTERSDLRKGMEMGADDYITKPFEKIELLNAVERRLKKADAIKKEYAKDIQGLKEFITDVSGTNTLKSFEEGSIARMYKKKDNIYREGDFPRGLYYVNKGQVKIYKTHDFGKELIISIINDSDYFGYSNLIEGKEYSESAEVMENSELTFIPKEDFFNLLYNNKDVAKKFLQILTRNMSVNEEKLLDLAYSSVRKRVADALLMLQSKFEIKDPTQTEIAITREDLANIVGTATESLIRTLSEFKSDKLIEIISGKIIITNRKKLQELKN